MKYKRLYTFESDYTLCIVNAIKHRKKSSLINRTFCGTLKTAFFANLSLSHLRFYVDNDSRYGQLKAPLYDWLIIAAVTMFIFLAALSFVKHWDIRYYYCILEICFKNMIH